MRDGNFHGTGADNGDKAVLDLPMRDGNPNGTVVFWGPMVVLDLPMRDGNVFPPAQCFEHK